MTKDKRKLTFSGIHVLQFLIMVCWQLHEYHINISSHFYSGQAYYVRTRVFGQLEQVSIAFR